MGEIKKMEPRKTDNGQVTDETKKQRHWFIELTKMVGWLLLMMITFILFFEILPVLILAFGHMTLLFGHSSQGPTPIDILVYIPSAMGLSGILTYFLYRVLKSQYKYVIRIQESLSIRFSKRMIERKEKRELKKSKK